MTTVLVQSLNKMHMKYVFHNKLRILFQNQKTLSLNFKSSHLQMFFKIGVLKNLAIFTGKHLCCFFDLLQTLTIHRTSGEEGRCVFNCSLPLPPTSRTLAGWLLQRAHLCTQPAGRLELGTFGFRLQVAYHKAFLPFNKVAGLEDCIFLKKRLHHRYFLWILRNF